MTPFSSYEWNRTLCDQCVITPWLMCPVRELKSCLGVMTKKGLATSCFGCLNSFWGDYWKGLATTSIVGLVTVLGANEKESYNPAIISGQTGCGRSFCPLLSLVENLVGEGPRNTGRQTGVLSLIVKHLKCGHVQSEALNVLWGIVYLSEDFPSG